MSALLPSTVEQALEMLAQPGDHVPVAGGTDLFVHWPQRAQDSERVYVDLSGLEELRPMRWTDDHLILGGLTTYWDVITDARAGREFPLLVQAGRLVGAVQIQSRGTWAGNVINASPAADGVPVMMAYDAVVVLRSIGGGVEEVPLASFYDGYKMTRRRPEQLVTEIRLPRRAHAFERFEKVGSRRQQAIAKVGLAMTRFDSVWRVVAASMAPVVCRCPTVEAVLGGEERISSPEDLLPLVLADVSPIDDVRSTARYRREVFARLLYYSLLGHHPNVVADP